MPKFIMLMGDTEIDLTKDVKKAKTQGDMEKLMKEGLEKVIKKEGKKKCITSS